MAECTSGKNLTVLVLDEFEARALKYLLGALDEPIFPLLNIYQALDG